VTTASALLSPARGDRFRAVGEVVRAGRTLTVCSAEVIAWAGGTEQKPVALMQATMMAVGPGSVTGRPRT
jgi:acyl-coenzyme A thioesterase PaaI-like protein